MLADNVAIAHATDELDVSANGLPIVLEGARANIERLRIGSEMASAVAELVERVELKRDGIQLSLQLPIATDERRDRTASNHFTLAKFIPMKIKRRGNESKMVLEGEAAPLEEARVDV
jgi:hypothetical protein